MIRIAITAEANEAIARTLALGSVAHELEVNAKGERPIWLESVLVDKSRRLARQER
jgi:hypothetical protein